MTQEIEISNLITNCQSREATYEDTVSEYAEAMREGEQFPAVIVYTDGNLFWLADGYHRTHAAMANGYKTIRAEIRQGSFRDAHKFSRKANKKNGRRLTNADKRYMVTDTWNKRGELGLGGNPSTSSLAQYCEVSEGFVRKLFNDGVITRPADAPRTGVDGRAYQYETTSYSTKSPLTAPPKIPNTAQNSTFDFSTPPRVNRPPLPDAPPPAAPGGSVQVPQPGGEFNPGALEGEIDGNSLCGEYDRFGLDLVDRGPEMRQAAAELDGVKEMIRAARRQLSALAAEGRPYIVKVTMQQTLIDLDNAARAVEAAKPYCVCRHCQGFAETRQYCNNCMTLGWQTKREYQCNAPEFKHESDR